MYKILLCILFVIPAFAVEQRQIEEAGFVSINGMDQWITIKGNASKPAILFLHGGPGSPISPYSENVYNKWEKDFLIVQWDQRGTGKTFGFHAPEELTPVFLKKNPLSLSQMTADGIAVAEYITKHLGKPKVILFGTSWGSLLGVMMATQRPDLFEAYVGHSQIVQPSNDEQLYGHVYEIAQKKKDKEALEILDSIGKPPYDRARKLGQLLKVVKMYEKQNSTPAPESWFVAADRYNNPKDIQNRSDGDDYSFVNYAGDAVLGVQSMRVGIDLLKDHVDFKIPVYLIQGKEDLLTPSTLTKTYFEKINAPKKKYVLLSKAAHGFNEDVVKAQYKICKSLH